MRYTVIAPSITKMGSSFMELCQKHHKEHHPEAVITNRMIMKDNDAGLISGNSAKSYHLLDKISHMDPKTYNRLLDLQKELQKPEVAQWYETELLFTPTDFKTMKGNVDEAVSILTARKDKSLFLDANVSAAPGAEGTQEQEDETTPESNDVSNTPLAVIAGSVGRWDKGSRNLQADVETVQRF